MEAMPPAAMAGMDAPMMQAMRQRQWQHGRSIWGNAPAAMGGMDAT